MQKVLLIIVLTISSVVSVFGKNNADSLFSKGGELYQQNKFAEAIVCFKEVALNYTSFKYYNQCLYNLAHTYNQIDSAEQAKYWYETIRASDVKDKDRVGGRGIFEPYANYKHYSTFNIATIDYNNGAYQKALDYYQECLTKYPYYSESGTDIQINTNKIKIYIVDCLKKLGRYDDALMLIVPQALECYGSSNYLSVVKSAIQLIDSNFDKQKIANELEEAFQTMKLLKKYKQFELTWREKDIILTPYINELTVADFVAQLKDQAFWKALQQ